MLDFEAELERLLSRETGRLPRYELVELASAGQEVLAELNKRQAEVSLQIEEIYDLVKEQEGLREAAEAEKVRANRLVLGAIGLADLLEDFCSFAKQSGSEDLNHQAELLWEKACGILSGCGIIPFGEAGQFLDPQIHTVKAGAASPFPREQVVQVLQRGYACQGALVRKASVVVSRGPEEPLWGSSEAPPELEKTYCWESREAPPGPEPEKTYWRESREVPPGPGPQGQGEDWE
jgi:molecular chaperone GrpE (heat shock protein)